MNKVIPKNFKDYYNWFCKERRGKSKVQFLENQHLKINADSLDKDDWSPLIKALKCDKDNLHSIIIYSRYSYKEFNKRSRLIQNNTTSKEPFFLKESTLLAVIDAIATCVINSEFLCNLYLEAVPLNDHYIKILNNSINRQMNLQHLALPYCNLNDENINTLCRTIRKHIGLQTIDLTGCGITYNGAKEISALIKSQKLVRYGETWKQSLRYRLPEPDILPGLRRITLNNNVNIRDEGFKIICYELLDDLWIKAIDFQNCGITNSSTEDALAVVKTNPYIHVLDIRRNNIFSGVMKNISDVLKKNKSNDDGRTYDWISTSESLVTSLSSYSTLQTSITSPVRTKNWANGKLMKNTHTCSMKSQSKSSTSNIRIDNINNNNNNNNNNELQLHKYISELEKTKILLRKVTSNLIEERTKRSEIEKEHEKFKEQLEEIRATCLIQNYNHINNKTKGSNSASITKSSICSKNRSSIKKETARIKKKNVVPTLKIPKSVVSSNFDIDNNSFKSARLLLIVPASNGKKSNKRIIHKKPSRIKSAVTKVTKTNSSLIDKLHEQ